MPRPREFDEQQVLEKAMLLFWEKGYHATSFSDLVDYLGVSRASIYAVYGKKKQLFDKAFQHYRTKNSTIIRELFRTQNNIKEGFRTIFSTAIQEANQENHKGCFVVNVTSELLPNDDEMKSLLQENHTTFEQLFSDYIMEGVKDGQIPSTINSKSVAKMLFIFYNGLRLVTKVNADEAQLLASVDEMLSLLD